MATTTTTMAASSNKTVYYIVAILVMLMAASFVFNYYFVTKIEDEMTAARERDRSPARIEQTIRRGVRTLRKSYLSINDRFFRQRQKLVFSMVPSAYENASIVFEVANLVSYNLVEVMSLNQMAFFLPSVSLLSGKIKILFIKRTIKMWALC